MRTSLRVVAAAAILLAATACNDLGPRTASSLELDDAFTATTAGFGQLGSSFSASSDAGAPWAPPAHAAAGPHPRGVGRGMPAMRGRGHSMMGGGLAGELMGAAGFGRGIGPGPFFRAGVPANCEFSEGTGRVTCDPVTMRGGLTVERSFAFADADGNVQSAPDSTTDSMNLRVSVSGTLVRPHDTTSVENSSDRTVTGLAAGSTTRTVNGTAEGTESSRGTSPRGAYTAVRSVADTTIGVEIPLVEGRPTYPAAGTITRVMHATLALEGADPVERSRRELVTFDGSPTATVVITQNGETRTCTMQLPRGRLVCG